MRGSANIALVHFFELCIIEIMKTGTSKELTNFSLPLTRDEAESIYDQGREVVIFVLLQMGEKLAQTSKQASHVTTPSGMIPPYEKKKVKKRKKKPGAKPGHTGHRRGEPDKITNEEEHKPVKICPDCGNTLNKVAERRFRLIEDIPETYPEVTRHSIPRCWCSQCKKFVEPPVLDAMPGSRIGHRVVTLSAWLHYGNGNTLSQIRSVLNNHMHFQLSDGGLIGAWQRLGEVLKPWYEQIREEAKGSAVLNAVETGWRVSGQTEWLWCFTAPHVTYYMIDRSRGSPALLSFFTEAFSGILVTDFWGPYNRVECAARQACLTHLFRELEKTDKSDKSEEWIKFRNKLKRLLKDSLRLGIDETLPKEVFSSRRTRLDVRLAAMIQQKPDNKNVNRIIKRLNRYSDAMFTFLDNDNVPSDNNRAEREIRPAVIMRKNSLCNRSENGANIQALLMSVYRTLKLRKYDPLEEIVAALREYIRTGTLPLLPSIQTSVG
jgi:transposase